MKIIQNEFKKIYLIKKINSYYKTNSKWIGNGDLNE